MLPTTMLKLFTLSLLAIAVLAPPTRANDRPNVVIVMTDDQGYGDLSCHGNPQLKTPNIDALHAESVRLTNFHVDPTCSPTRSALMTGKYSRRVGVWHTIMGRSLLPSDEITMAEHFAAAGYDTAIFGKWHLGDNYPLRPQDQGFGHVLVHGGGGVGQTPDYWGNDYFDDTYQLNGHWSRFEGYCTDVWFRNAERWLSSRSAKPFLLYLAPNAAHAPYNVAKEYSRPFHEMGIPSPRAEFYGMIVNIDENIGRLRAHLNKLGLAKNTIFIFMTDNGSAAGAGSGGYNAGMRGAKGSEYEGGHRVPCFIHWPAGGLDKGIDINALAAHFDLLPTLAALCEVPLENADELDGVNLAPVLTQSAEPPVRAIIVESQRVEKPVLWRKSCVISGPWRLINGRELYNIASDPGQTADVASDHAEAVKKLRSTYQSWWNDVSQTDDEVTRITLGAPAAPKTTLTAHDWHPPQGNARQVPWNQRMIAEDPPCNGAWFVDVARPGRYQFHLRRRPASDPLPIAANRATIVCGAQRNTAQINSHDESPALILDLPAGPARLKTILQGTDGQTRGAYYVAIERLAPAPRKP